MFFTFRFPLDIIMNKEERGKHLREYLLTWIRDNSRDFAWRRDDISLYEMLVAEMFLKRTRPDVVEPIYKDFIERYPTLQHLNQADKEKITELISPLGLQNRRSASFVEIAERLVDDGVPDDIDSLLELPQVGNYIANATLTFGVGEPVPVVDRNVDRLYGRVFGDEWPEDEELQYEFADWMLPDDGVREFNLGLLDFPSEICTAQNPDCNRCGVSEFCEYFANNQQE